MARMSAVEEMAGMDILCSDKTGTLTLNQLSVDKSTVLVTYPGLRWAAPEEVGEGKGSDSCLCHHGTMVVPSRTGGPGSGATPQ